MSIIDVPGDFPEGHDATVCKGGKGWIGDANGGMPWDPCPIHWPTQPTTRGPKGHGTEFISLTPAEAAEAFPGFWRQRGSR